MLNRILEPCTIIRVQAWDATASVPSVADEILGVSWPSEVGAVASGPVDILCIGPTDWLVIDGHPDNSELCQRLDTASAESPLRATDVSHTLMRVALEGPDVREFLLKGCSLDLHPNRFPLRRCTRTRFAGVPIVLRCHDSSRFEAIAAASYREYLLAWVADAST